MLTLTCTNQDSQDPRQLNRTEVLDATRAIRQSWTNEEKLHRAAMAKKQTLKLIELVLGNAFVSSRA